MASRSLLGPGWRRLAATFCLLAHLAGATEFFPEFLGLLCSLDPSHTVYIVHDDVDVRLVLSHENGRRTGQGYRSEQDPRSACHRHGLFAKVICSLSTPTTTEEDHEALFPAGAATEVNSALEQGKAAGGTGLHQLNWFAGSFDPIVVERPRTSLTGFTESLLRSIRSTVLLI